jgi:hypothetical protein
VVIYNENSPIADNAQRWGKKTQLKVINIVLTDLIVKGT